jgi:hypothetical protein
LNVGVAVVSGAVLGGVTAAALDEATGNASVAIDDDGSGKGGAGSEAGGGGTGDATFAAACSGLSWERTRMSTTIAPMAKVVANPSKTCSDDADFVAGDDAMKWGSDVCVSIGPTPGIEASVRDRGSDGGADFGGGV